jgi:uncharacterized membrane protein (DUF2068 family)
MEHNSRSGDTFRRSGDEHAPMGSAAQPQARRDRLLPWIAAERGLRALLFLVVGIVLVSHPNTDWASEIARFARHFGFDPNGSGLHKLIDRVKHIHAHQDLVFGSVAIAYGVLEGVEAYGLWRRRRWAEWLTVFATSVLFVPEIWELTKSASVLKVGALLVNVAVVAYLIWRLRRE